MKRTDAKIGMRVTAWTAMNGEYVGELVEIKSDRRPWRGVVHITGILQCWCLCEYRRYHQRTGFNIGDMIEVGGINISPASDEIVGASQEEVLHGEIAKAHQWLETPAFRRQDIAQRILREAKRQLNMETHGNNVDVIVQNKGGDPIRGSV